MVMENLLKGYCQFWVTFADVFPQRSGFVQQSAEMEWAVREKVVLISLGYQNIFATRLSFDSGKIHVARTHFLDIQHIVPDQRS